jgi:hypothetical protein
MFYDHVGDDGVPVAGLFTERATNVWGSIKTGSADKRYEELLKLVALVNGAAHGFGKGAGISKKWPDLRTNLFKPIDEDETIVVLDELFSIYEAAAIAGGDLAMRRTHSKKIQGCQKDTGNFNGPIIYSLITYNTEWTNLRKGWLGALADYRVAVCEDGGKGYLKDELHKGLSSARSWNNHRWKNAYNNVFGIESESVSHEEDDEEEEEHESDY